MRNYYIDFYKVVKDLLPHFLQKKGVLSWVDSNNFFWVTADGQNWSTGAASRHLQWLKTLVTPLFYLNTLLAEFVNKIRYKMYLTGQVVYLEHYINDLFDNNFRRIYIQDGDASLPLFLNNKIEGDTFDIYNKSEGQTDAILLNRADFASQVDFKVKIPWENIPTSERNKIKAYIDKYKIAGKRYSINTTVGGPSYPITS